MLDGCPPSVLVSACMFYTLADKSCVSHSEKFATVGVKRPYLRTHEASAAAAAPLLETRGVEPVAAARDLVPSGAKAQRAHLLLLRMRAVVLAAAAVARHGR